MWSHRAWNRHMDPEYTLHMLTIWPPPETAYQIIYQFLQIFVQSPLDTAAVRVEPAGHCRYHVDTTCHAPKVVPLESLSRLLPSFGDTVCSSIATNHSCHCTLYTLSCTTRHGSQAGLVYHVRRAGCPPTTCNIYARAVDGRLTLLMSFYSVISVTQASQSDSVSFGCVKHNTIQNVSAWDHRLPHVWR
jgi:hypothetical protein